ncbi:MAG: ArsA family ATPase [Bdellovibrionales bacterium]
MELSSNKTTIFLGTGGVGKTTLSSIYAIKLANTFPDKKIKLVTIDPSKRLRDYFSMGIEDSEKEIENLSISVSGRADLMKDFVSEVYKGNTAEIEKIYENKIFQKLVTGLAVSQEFTSLYEVYKNNGEDVDYLIVDTPPLQNAGSFLSGAGELQALFSSSLAKLFIFSEDEGLFSKIFFKARKKGLGILSNLTGKTFVGELANFFMAVEKLRPQLLAVLEESKRILHDDTDIVCICNYNELSLGGLKISLKSIQGQGLKVRKCIFNKYRDDQDQKGFVQKKSNEIKEENRGLDFYQVGSFDFEVLTYEDLQKVGASVEF